MNTRRSDDLDPGKMKFWLVVVLVLGAVGWWLW